MIEFVATYKVGWFQWSLPGSYYIPTKSGATVPDQDEDWGMFSPDLSTFPTLLHFY
jgi:hypothetical protein